MLSVQHTNLALLTVAFLSVITAGTGLHAQDPRLAALDSLRAMSLDSVPGVAAVNYRPADPQRVLETLSGEAAPTTVELVEQFEARAPGTLTLLDSPGVGYRSRGEDPVVQGDRVPGFDPGP